jgi:2'-5' RNA ligase
LFVAVHFSPEVRRVLLGAIGAIRSGSRQASTTRPENLHLTLAFIGETDDLRGAWEAVSSCVRPAFGLTVGGSGRFGDLYWAGIGENPQLAALAEAVQTALCARGFNIERRPFKPHITLARQVQSDAPLRLTVPETAMTVRRISLMRSDRIAGRLTYTEVFGADLI